MQWKLLAAVLIFLAAGSQEPVKVPMDEAVAHRLGLPGIIHSKVRKKEESWNQNVTLNVVVNEGGKVESVKALTGPKDFLGEAERIESERKFKPFVQRGRPVRVTFEDYVLIMPPEEWSDVKMPFPEIKDWSTLKIKLRRTMCYGSCPDYSIEIHGDGQVDFQGNRNTFIAGQHRGRISKQHLQSLMAVFKQANYFSLKDQYLCRVTDNPAYTTSIEFDGVRKSVVDYVGLEVGMPQVVTEVEDAVDRLTGSEKWIKGI